MPSAVEETESTWSTVGGVVSITKGPIETTRPGLGLGEAAFDLSAEEMGDPPELLALSFEQVLGLLLEASAQTTKLATMLACGIGEQGKTGRRDKDEKECNGQQLGRAGCTCVRKHPSTKNRSNGDGHER